MAYNSPECVILYFHLYSHVAEYWVNHYNFLNADQIIFLATASAESCQSCRRNAKEFSKTIDSSRWKKNREKKIEKDSYR